MSYKIYKGKRNNENGRKKFFIRIEKKDFVKKKGRVVIKLDKI